MRLSRTAPEVDSRQEDGRTPLLLAAEHLKRESARALLLAQADIGVRFRFTRGER